jgi:hypothetical protein
MDVPRVLENTPYVRLIFNFNEGYQSIRVTVHDKIQAGEAMGFFSDHFSHPYPSDQGQVVNKLMDELIRIGVQEDYLSERPGGAYNAQSRHVRTRDIGRRFYEIGGLELMKWAHKKVRKKVSKIKAEHLEYAWDGVGPWKA